MSTNAESGCGRGENKYVKEIHFLYMTSLSGSRSALFYGIKYSMYDLMSFSWAMFKRYRLYNANDASTFLL